MAIELPGFLAKLFNLMGLAGGAGWTNLNEDTASNVGGVYGSHAPAMQTSTQDAKTHGQYATAAVQGPAGNAMTAAIEHPQGPINNLTDHAKGALVMSLIVGEVIPQLVRTYKMAKIIDGATTVGDMAASASVPGGEAAWPEELAAGRLAQETITNVTAAAVMG